jgi:hypothetical protein
MPLPLIKVLQDGHKLVALVRYHVPNIHQHLLGQGMGKTILAIPY